MFNSSAVDGSKDSVVSNLVPEAYAIHLKKLEFCSCSVAVVAFLPCVINV